MSDQWALATVANGYRISFQRSPLPISRVYMTVVKDSIQAQFLAQEVLTLLPKGAMKVNPSDQSTGFYLKYFLILKKDGRLRPILDMRRLNKFLKFRPFRMLSVKQTAVSIEKRKWFTALDLKDAYLHVAIYPDHRPFLLFMFQGHTYQLQFSRLAFPSLHKGSPGLCPPPCLHFKGPD